MTQAQIEQAAYRLITYETRVVKYIEAILKLTHPQVRALPQFDEGVILGFKCGWPVFSTADWIMNKSKKPNT